MSGAPPAPRVEPRVTSRKAEKSQSFSTLIDGRRTATAGSADVHFSSAIGSNTSANFASSTALGFGAQTTAANQMMFGTATNIYALPGVNSAESRAAQKPPLMMLTVDAAGNVSTAPIPTCRCPRPPVKPKSRKN
jgi:hypothetical protein